LEKGDLRTTRRIARIPLRFSAVKKAAAPSLLVEMRIENKGEWMSASWHPAPGSIPAEFDCSLRKARRLLGRPRRFGSLARLGPGFGCRT